jgi:MFS family permease
MLASSHKPKKEEEIKPFPKGALTALCIVLFANSYALSNPFPYVGFMVKYFGLTEDDREVGFYAGYVMSAFMFGRALSSFLCGWISDKYGRKVVLYAGIISCLVFSPAFGFAQSFSAAIAARFFMGFFNGNPPLQNFVVVALTGNTRH